MVSDASVIAAMAFNEPEAPHAVALIGGTRLYEPHLLAFELTNIARTKTRAEPDRGVAFAEGLADALLMDIVWQPISYRDVLGLALETGLTAYDASYLFLAESLGVPLATFDARLRAAAHGRGTVLS